MKYTAIRLAVAVVTFVIGSAVAGLFHPFRGSAADEREVLRVEREYIRATLDADTDTLRSILADDFTLRTRSGEETDKAERLELLENPQFAFDTISTENVRAEVSGDTAVVTGDIYIRSHRGSRASCASYTYEREFEKRDGRWQIVAVYLRP